VTNGQKTLVGGVVAAAFALAAALLKVDGRSVIEPATVLTVALVIATIYYALQTLDMSASMRTQVAEASRADLARQREAQILAVEPLLIPMPLVYVSERLATVAIHVGERPVLNLTVTLRAMMAAPDPDSTDGRGSDSGGLGSYAPASHVTARIPLDLFLEPARPTSPPRPTPYEDIWQVELTYHGLLGQWVVETYVWRIRDNLREGGGEPHPTWWHLQRLQIQPSLSGAASLDLTFDA